MTEEIKKKFDKRTTAIASVVAVLVVAVIGGFAWHATPSFCGTVCHDTMNIHVMNYNGTDESAGAGLASVHREAGVGCLDCHQATMDEQIKEAQMQFSGKASEIALTSTYYDNNQACLDCHEGTREALAEKTASLGDFNPHMNIHGEKNCNECHKGHSAQVDNCALCHDNHGQTMKG